ncbi:gliding motility-associated C-terminal domain-containing protein [uncultured Tenacibaculum sp.]|uniref:T9SS type B sorting domain-containing protein n=1 Tax=uncultured Tenacibaculum sp. TaxID=174713 RepID=UPI00261531CE|nr:gliding motility-associated C-terminal domain-containing protein [uncultured Tenacibaculum sp.]
MYKCKKNTSTIILIVLLCLLHSGYSYAQTLNAPTLQFGNSACASVGADRFCIDFSFIGTAFDPSNVFTLQLSDSNGDFTTPEVVNLREITGENDQFFVGNVCFQLPVGTYGQNYRVRIVSSLPVMESPASDVFDAFYKPTEDLILNGRNALVLCGGPETVSVNVINPDYTYVWFKVEGGREIEIPGETGSTLTISEPGRYYAAVDAGACTQAVGGGLQSNFLTVTEVAPSSLTIEGANTVQICANETYELVSSIDDPSFLYKWFKDGNLITGLADYTPRYTTPTSNQFGVYHLEIEVSGCSSRSQDVTVEQRPGANFEINLNPPATRIRLPGETIELGVTHTATSPTFQWFRDGAPLPARNQVSTNATQEGEYFIEVTDNSGTCPTSRNSDVYTIVDAVGFNVEIRPSTDYAECGIEQTQLSIVGVRALGSDGNEYDLSSDQVSSLNFQWNKDGNPIAGATFEQLDVDSYNDNGEYTLTASVGTISSDSNIVNVLLTVTGVEIRSSSVSNSLCPGETITFNIDIEPGFVYTWFKDGAELTVADPSTVVIDEIGTYSVTYEGFGCLNNVTEVNVVEFDDSVLEVSPSSTAVLEPGETITLEASGADSYEWFDAAGNLLSSNETLDVNTLGTFTLFGTVGGCRAQREINVVEDDGKLVIPNIVTPFNGDGINDTWELPNRFAFQTDVQVIIYDSRGKEVLNTTDYQNNWPMDNNFKDGMLFYFRVIRENNLIKAGTISILQ